MFDEKEKRANFAKFCSKILRVLGKMVILSPLPFLLMAGVGCPRPGGSLQHCPDPTFSPAFCPNLAADGATRAEVSRRLRGGFTLPVLSLVGSGGGPASGGEQNVSGSIGSGSRDRRYADLRGYQDSRSSGQAASRSGQRDGGRRGRGTVMRRWQRQDGASVPQPPTEMQTLNTDAREDADLSESYRARISYCTRTRARAVSTISAVDILIEDIPDIDLVEVAALVVGAHRILLTVVGHPKVGLRHVREEGTSRRYDPVLEAVCLCLCVYANTRKH